MEQTFDNLLGSARKELKAYIRQYGTWTDELLHDLADLNTPAGMYEVMSLALEMFVNGKAVIPEIVLETLRVVIYRGWREVLWHEAKRIRDEDIRDLFLDN